DEQVEVLARAAGEVEDEPAPLGRERRDRLLPRRAVERLQAPVVEPGEDVVPPHEPAVRVRSRLASYRAMSASGGVLAMTSPTSSRGRSSSARKRRHDFPMSIFFPARSKAACSRVACVGSA